MVSIHTSSAYKNLSVMMKASKGILEIFKILGRESITAGNVTEVQKGREALNHLRWYMARNSGKIDLKHGTVD